MQGIATSLVTPPAAEPVTAAEAKAQCAITGTDHDTRLASLITRAREYVENYTGRAIITQTWDYFADSFEQKIELPYAPLQSVTTVKYYDTAGVQQTLSSSLYTVSTNAQPGYIVPAYNEDWPDIRDIPEAVEIRFIAGYGAASTDVPDTLRHAMLLLISHWFENTEAQEPFSMNDTGFGVNALLDQYRIWRA